MNLTNEKPFIAGNWKMHKTIPEALDLVEALREESAVQEEAKLVVIPPFTALSEISKAIEGSRVGLGAQNMYWEELGAFTGEESPVMVAELCQYVILGHSERRAFFGEMDTTVNLKVNAALDNNIIPIVCVGETLEENEAGRTKEVVSRQIKEGLVGLNLPVVNGSEGNALIVAYEPVWAIGTGKTATPDQAQEVHAFIRKELEDMYSSEIAENIRIQYGGSVKPDNISDLIVQPDIDGALVGGASLQAESFAQIVRLAGI